MRIPLSRAMLPSPMRHSSSGDSSGSSGSSSNTTSSSSNMLLYGFLGVLCFVRTIESAPLSPENGDAESSRLESTETLLSGLQSKKGQDEEVGNPSEIAYQAWLLIDGHPDSHPLGGLDSASLLRRIKPKSIFVAPNLTACPDGYQDDTMNRCVKDVNIDHQAHKGFLVQRLQAIFGSKAHAAASSSSLPSLGSEATGPLQLNIPLLVSAPAKPPPPPSPVLEKMEKTATTDSSKKIEKNVDKNHQDTIVTVYELNEDESTFFLGNKTSGSTQETDKKDPPKSDLLATKIAAQFVNETNSGVVDYEIPTTNPHNLTLLVGGTIDEANEGTYEDTPSRVHADESNISPTLVLLLSPTKVPSIPVDRNGVVEVTRNSSLGQVIVKMENVTGNDDAIKEIIRVSVPDAIAASSTDSSDDSTTQQQLQDEERFPASTDSTEAYYEENYEESTENDDEILKHSEAGMTVTLAAPIDEATDRPEDVDEEANKSSEISSEVSINGDFIRETTLVDFNVGKTVNSTDLPIVNGDNVESTEVFDEVTEIPEDNQENDAADVDKANVRKATLREKPIVVLPTFEPMELEEAMENSSTTTESSSSQVDSGETMIASSTNDARTVVSRQQPKLDMASLSSSKKRAGQPFRAATTTKIPKPFVATLPNVEGVVYDYEPREQYPQHRNPYGDRSPIEEDVPVIRTIGDHQQHRYRPDNEEEDQNFFPLRQQQQQQRDYVRFPSYDRNGRPNFVRFPSEEANSINPNDYKERRPYNRYQQQQNPNHGRTDSKNPSEQDVRQKQSYWWLPPGWRMDKQQQEVEQRLRTSSTVDRSRTPMLLRFWTRMPLVKDPSLNYQHPTYAAVGQRDSELPRRVNYYKELSTHDFNRAFARKSLLPSAVGG